MPIIFTAGTWIGRGLTFLGAYDVIDWFKKDEPEDVYPPEVNYTLMGTVGIIAGYFTYKHFSKKKRRYRRRRY